MSCPQRRHWPFGGEEYTGRDWQIEYAFCDDEHESEEAICAALDTIMRHGEEEVGLDGADFQKPL